MQELAENHKNVQTEEVSGERLTHGSRSFYDSSLGQDLHDPGSDRSWTPAVGVQVTQQLLDD